MLGEVSCSKNQIKRIKCKLYVNLELFAKILNILKIHKLKIVKWYKSRMITIRTMNSSRGCLSRTIKTSRPKTTSATAQTLLPIERPRPTKVAVELLTNLPNVAGCHPVTAILYRFTRLQQFFAKSWIKWQTCRISFSHLIITISKIIFKKMWTSSKMNRTRWCRQVAPTIKFDRLRWPSRSKSDSWALVMMYFTRQQASKCSHNNRTI